MKHGMTSLLLLLAVAVFGGTAQAQQFNGGAITINASGTATPYPSAITVTGVTGTVTNVTVTLNNFSHLFPEDVGALLVGPLGQTVLLFDGPGSGIPAVNLTWTFSDSGATPLPNDGALSSGTFLPGQNQFDDPFEAPAPAGPYGTTFSVFNNTDVNGEWTLYVEDFVIDNDGSIASWNINITTSAVPEPATFALCGGVLVSAYALRRYRLRKVNNLKNARFARAKKA